MVYSKNDLFWIHMPAEAEVADDRVQIRTAPHTDLWQRTYYGFRNDNAPLLLTRVAEPFFSFTVRASYKAERRYDQCGVAVYQDGDNWLKASVEYENAELSRLGSVVTNAGYSDWATTDIPSEEICVRYYRLSRRESDFLIESSPDGQAYQQMRIARLHAGSGAVNVGLYACSPEQSSFTASFTQMAFTECVWKAHE